MHVIRTLLPTEFGLLRAHLLRLDPEDRRRRFAGQIGDDAVAAYVAALDRFRSTVVAWIEDGQVRGAAELLRFRAPAGTRAELAVTVERAWQDRGIGSELMRRALTIARNRGLDQVLMVCLAENGRMRHLADKFHGRMIDTGGEVEASVPLLAPDAWSLWQEAIDQGAAAIGEALEQWKPSPAAAKGVRPAQARVDPRAEHLDGGRIGGRRGALRTTTPRAGERPGRCVRGRAA
ncbi:MAG: GNAT family N-acetyltransferase [Alphaproteobacteria bacterium]|nr:GNAT family N-acetyltransferase [Alphaproteobacteria bacterium]